MSSASHVWELHAGLWDPSASRCLMNILRAAESHQPWAALCTPAEGAVETDFVRRKCAGLWVRCLPSQRCEKWRSKLGHVPCPASPKLLRGKVRRSGEVKSHPELCHHPGEVGSRAVLRVTSAHQPQAWWFCHSSDISSQPVLDALVWSFLTRVVIT